MSGKSLVLTDAPLGGFFFNESGPRTDDTHFLTITGNLSPSIEADMAFLSVMILGWEPNGPIGQLDSELLGTQYDGQELTFAVGGGISTGSAPPSGDMFSDLQAKHDWVLGTLTYDSCNTLIEVLDDAVINPALKKRYDLEIRKAQNYTSPTC